MARLRSVLPSFFAPIRMDQSGNSLDVAFLLIRWPSGGGSLSAELQLHPLLSVSLGRQPYTDESQGSLLVRLSDGAFGNIAVLTPVATVLVAGNHYKLELSGPKLQRGQTTVLSFPLMHLPPTILGDANATVSFELAGVAAATPLPFVRLGQAQASQSIVDYATGAVLTGPERVPLLPNGFDSHFSSASGAAFDESLAFDLARRGFNTVIFGACLDGIFSAQVRLLALLYSQWLALEWSERAAMSVAHINTRLDM